MDFAELLRSYLGGQPATAPPDTGDYAAALQPMLNGKVRSRDFTVPPSGLRPSPSDEFVPNLGAAKSLAASAVEPFGQLGRVMTGQSQDTLADIVGAAAGLAPIGPPGVAKALGKLAKPAAEAAETAATGGLGDFIKAYHGSPHDFERFDLGKIGTGEGAQAYGHGLYFAENEQVAKEYRNALSKGVVDWNDPHAVAAHFMDSAKGNRTDALFNAQTHVGIKNMDALKQAQDMIESGAPIGASKAGRMYQVAIKAPPEHFLDWDKPLSEQSPRVQKALRAAGLAAKPADLGEFMGQKIQSAPRWADTAADSAKLREAGIPGIKYLDQGSRGKGDGSRNYVVFDDKLIDILKKYGIAGIGALPAMNAYHYQDKGG